MPDDFKKLRAEIRQLYAEIAALTKPKCGECPVPYHCCEPDMCKMIETFAKEDGIELPPRTDHPKLPYMGPEGCILEPYQRPLCAIHVCEYHLWNLNFSIKYHHLRACISEKEFELEDGE
jgi:hypothetical protein